jgi:peptidyl-prolyl cis-trans isomerase C
MRLHIWALAALTGAAGLLAAAGPARAQAQQAPSDPKAVVATVNGRSITLGEVDAIIAARGLTAVALPAPRVRQMRFEALCALIDGMLWEQYLAKNGPRIDAAEVNKKFAELDAAVKKAGKTMQDYYKDYHVTEKEVRAGIVAALQWDAIVARKVAEADVKRYYDENKDFFDEVTVHASHIMLKVPATAPEAEKQKARENLLAIRAHIVAGKLDFAEAARRFSQDATAADGGDMGTFPRKLMIDETLAKAAFALPQGGVSDIVQSEYGMHLIKVLERHADKKPSKYEEVKDYVQLCCVTEFHQAIMAQLRKDAKIKIDLK